MTKLRYGFAAILVVSVGLEGCDSAHTDGSGGQTCTYNGKAYPDRTSWWAPDGCNECTCLGGYARCNAGPPCDAGAQSNLPCIYNGTSYSFGVTFPSTDGCNICECSWRWFHGVDPGPAEVACTLRDSSASRVCDAGRDGDAAVDGCVFNGTTYPPDVYFPSADGCDECHCRTDGQVTCTYSHIGCPG